MKPHLTSEFVLGFISAICVLVIMACIGLLIYKRGLEREPQVEYNISNEGE